MRIKILKCKYDSYWYHDEIGKIYHTIGFGRTHKNEEYYVVKEEKGKVFVVLKEDSLDYRKYLISLMENI